MHIIWQNVKQIDETFRSDINVNEFDIQNEYNKSRFSSGYLKKKNPGKIPQS